MCNDTSVAGAARDIFALFLSSDTVTECIAIALVLFPLCCLTTRRIPCFLSLSFLFFWFCFVVAFVMCYMC